MRSNSKVVQLHPEDEAKAQEKPPVKFSWADVVDDEPDLPAEFIVQDLAEVGIVTMVAGEGGIGKTFLGQMLCYAAAKATEQDDVTWLDRTVSPCASFMVLSEDPRRPIRARHTRLCEYYQLSGDALRQVSWISDYGKFPIIYQSGTKRSGYEGEPTPLWNTIFAHCKEQHVRMIVLDNLGKVFRGDRNNAEQVGSFITFLNYEAEKLKASIWLLAHPPKDRSNYFSGSQAIEDTLRATLSFRRPADYDPITKDGSEKRELIMEKHNEMPDDHPLRVKGIPLKWEKGVLVTRQFQTRRQTYQMTDRELEDKVLAAVAAMVDNGYCVALDSWSPFSFVSYSRRHSQWRQIGGYKISGAIKRLVEKGAATDFGLDVVKLKGVEHIRGKKQVYHSEVEYQSLIADAAE